MYTSMNRWISFLVVCFLLVCFGAAAENSRYSLTDAGLDLGIHSIHYPRLTDSENDADSSITEKANETLADVLHAKALTARMASVLSSSVPLVSYWDGQIVNDLLSAHLHVSGPIEHERSDSADYSILLDLRDLSTVPFSSFFSDPEAAEHAIAEILEWNIAPTLSPHLANAEVLPLPEAYGADPWSLMLYYPSSQLMTLSGNAGQIRIYWYELQNLLDTSEGSPADRLGILAACTLSEASFPLIRAAVESGSFPSVPVTVGDSIKQLAQKHPLLHDPDNIEGSRLFELEGAPLQGIQLLTDTLSLNSYETSVVEAIRADSMCLYGLITGMTTQEAWRQILGEPSATVTLDAETAELYRLVPGVSDYYTFGSRTLRLHADESHTLQTLFIQ